MKLLVDEDVKRVLEFMQGSMSAARLVGVASAVHGLAPMLWGHFETESISALRLVSEPLNGLGAEHKQPSARSPLLGLACAGDGSGAEVS